MLPKLIIRLKNIKKQDSLGNLVFLILFCFLLLYYFTRAMNDPLKGYILLDFKITEGQFGLFTSMFSLGYSFQIISGWLINKFKFKAIIIYILCTSLILFFMYYMHDYKYFVVSRFALGFLFSGAMTGFVFFITTYYNEYYGVIINTSKFILLVSSGFFISYLNEIDNLDYRLIFKTGSGILFICGAICMYCLFMAKRNHRKYYINDQNLSTNNSLITDLITPNHNAKENTVFNLNILKSWKFLLMIAISILSATQYYGLIDGYLKPIANDIFTQKNITSILIKSTAPLLLITGILTRYISCKTIIIILGTIQVISNILMYLYAHPLFIIISSASAYNIHLIIQIWASQIYIKNATIYISILNMLTMFGASFSEYLSSQIISHLFNNISSYHSTMFLIQLYALCGLCALLLNLKNKDSSS